MKSTPIAPNPVYSLRDLLVGSGLLFATVFAVLLAVSYPVPVLSGAVGLVLVGAVGRPVLTWFVKRRGSVRIPFTELRLTA